MRIGQNIMFKLSINLICVAFLNFPFYHNLIFAETPIKESSNKFVYLGSYSDMKYTEEHQYGFEVDLWKMGNTLFGHFLHSEGLIGDTPTGLLENIKYFPETRELSFEAKLTMGIHYCKDHKGVPSRDKYEFKGRIKGKELIGTLTERDGLHDNEIIKIQKIKLIRDQEKEELLSNIKTLEKWKNYSNMILKHRGPKW